MTPANELEIQMSFSIAAPKGAHWEFIDKDGVEYPILVWDDVKAAFDRYGVDGVAKFMNTITLRTVCLGIATRYAKAGKSPEDAAIQILSYVPGKRKGGTRTPRTRARAAVDAAIESTGDAALVTEFLNRLTEGKIDTASLKAALANA